MSSKVIAKETRTILQASAGDLDRRIEALVAEIAVAEGCGELTASRDEPLRPRWIRPSELVRRMQPFMVWN